MLVLVKKDARSVQRCLLFYQESAALGTPNGATCAFLPVTLASVLNTQSVFFTGISGAQFCWPNPLVLAPSTAVQEVPQAAKRGRQALTPGTGKKDMSPQPWMDR